MNKIILKILILFGLLHFSNNVNIAQKYNKKVEKEINKILDDDYFQSTILAVDIYDLTTKKVIYRNQPKMLLHPASNMKVITTATALEYLGPDYNFETSVYHTGIVMDSICYGDVYIVGGFDPDFTTEDLDTVVSKIKEFGIKEIRGDLYGDVSKMDSLFWGNGWMWDDDPSTDFPYMSPLIINDAAVKIVYRPGIIGKEMGYELIPQTNFFSVTNESVTTKEDTSDFEITRNWLNRSNEISITGDISYKEEQDTVEINVVNSEFYFMYLFKEKLEKSSVTVRGKIDTLKLPEYSKPIYVHKRKFRDVIKNLNKESDNLSAEMTLRALALKYDENKATAKNGVKVIDSLITKIGLNYKDYRIVDGSGVSHYNLVTPELMLEVLKYLYLSSKANYKILYYSLPIAGVDGTLDNRMKKGRAYKNVHAKTGTLSGVSTLSGYLLSKNRHRIAFSIFIQNYVKSGRVARYYQDRICKFLCNTKL